MKKIFVIFLTVIYICGCIIPVFADESVPTPFDTTAFRTIFKEDFDDESVDSSAMVIWKPANTQIVSSGEGHAFKMSCTTSGQDPTLVFDDGDSEGTANGADFTGKHIISFKCKLNNLSHKLSIFIKTLGDSPTTYRLLETVKNKVKVHGVENNSLISANQEYQISLYLDSEAETIGVKVGDSYFEEKYTGLDFEHVSFRIQSVPQSGVSETQEVLIDDYVIKTQSDAKPVITLIGSETMEIELGSDFEDPGYTANDKFEGNLTDKVVVTGEVNTHTIGTYILKYDVTNNDGISAVQCIRTVKVVEELTLNEPFSSKDFRIRAFEDFEDGELSVPFVVWKQENTEIAKYNGNYAMKLFCESGSSDPTFAYDGDSKEGTDYSGRHVISFKYKLNNFSHRVVWLLKTMTGTSKTYKLLESVKGSISVLNVKKPGILVAGKEYKIRIYIDSNAKTIGLLIDNVYYEDTYNDLDFTNLSLRMQCVPQSDVSEKQEVWIDDFKITHNNTPNLTLKGDNTVIVRAGSVYQEPGYTASDFVYGNITNSVVVGGTVDIEETGTYKLSYDVTTEDNAKSETLYRTVIVKPVNRIDNFSCTADCADSLYPASNLFDGDFLTQWRSNISDEIVVITGSSDKFSLIDRIGIASDDTSVIADYELQVSKNGNDWTNVAFDNIATSDGVELRFEPCEIKHFKLTLTKNPSYHDRFIAINAVEGYANDDTVTEKDSLLINVGYPSGTLNNDLILKTTGTYGSKIKWKSSDTSAISDSGTLLSPDKNTTVYMTATLTFNKSVKRMSYGPFIVNAASNTGSSNTKKPTPGASISIRNESGGGISAPSKPVTPVGGQSVRFNDVPKTHWAYSHIDELATNGIISQTANFEPERSITREEFLKIILLSLGIPAEEATGNFTDVSSDWWAAPYIYTANKLGIVNGISETEFGSERFITRQDMAVMTIRALKSAGKLADGSLGVDTVSPFTDAYSISDYALSCVESLTSLSVVGGYPDGSFNPRGNLSRAEAAKIATEVRKLV